MQKPVLILDGSEFRDLNGFFDDVSRSLIPGAAWGRGLDSFNDILRGGFGTPEGGFVLRWLHSDNPAPILVTPKPCATSKTNCGDATLVTYRLSVLN